MQYSLCVYYSNMWMSTEFFWHSITFSLVLVLVITGKGTACIPDQHKINTIIKISNTKINLELIKWVYLYMIYNSLQYESSRHFLVGYSNRLQFY